jgi:hypothetical protein
MSTSDKTSRADDAPSSPARNGIDISDDVAPTIQELTSARNIHSAGTSNRLLSDTNATAEMESILGGLTDSLLTSDLVGLLSKRDFYHILFHNGTDMFQRQKDAERMNNAESNLSLNPNSSQDNLNLTGGDSDWDADEIQNTEEVMMGAIVDGKLADKIDRGLGISAVKSRASLTSGLHAVIRDRRGRVGGTVNADNASGTANSPSASADNSANNTNPTQTVKKTDHQDLHSLVSDHVAKADEIFKSIGEELDFETLYGDPDEEGDGEGGGEGGDKSGKSDKSGKNKVDTDGPGKNDFGATAESNLAEEEFVHKWATRFGGEIREITGGERMLSEKAGRVLADSLSGADSGLGRADSFNLGSADALGSGDAENVNNPADSNLSIILADPTATLDAAKKLCLDLRKYFQIDNTNEQVPKKVSKKEYIQTKNDNKVSRSAVLCGPQNIEFKGCSVVEKNVTLRGDLALIRCGKFVTIGEGTVIRPSPKAHKPIYFPIRIGDFVAIGSNCVISAQNIGNNVIIEDDCVR